jgi:hypothetical protein
VTDLRRAAELRAGPVLVLLARLPRAAVFAAVFGCLVGGLLLGGVLGAVLLLVVLTLLGLQLLFAWPVHTPGQRGLRLAVLLLIVVAGIRNL